MFLKSIILNNIRSYKNQTIFFQEGITLLSGDIGSGKSSILFAIEFALFGASRPDIPAEALIRKGTSHASVTLNFKLQIQNNYQEFIIHRTLKKTKLGIKQTGGYIIQNGQKFELTAIELKAKIIELLSYPEEFISKGKNYIYRYTIYCPQEEMKQILIDSTDNRFDILRKIFNIEKYKLVRENIVIYLKSLRKEITILETRCEQLPMKEQEQQQLKAILVKLINEFSLFSKDIAKQSKIYKTQRQSLDILNSNQRKRQDIISKKETLFKLYQSLEKREQQLDSNLSNLVSRRKSLLIASNQTADSNQTIDIIRAQILELTNKSQAITSKHQEFQHQLKSLQNQIKDYQDQITSFEISEQKLNNITLNIQELKSQINGFGDLKSDLAQIDHTIKELLQSKAATISQINTFDQRLQSISNLTHCPTCEQDVPKTHCQKIIDQIKNQIIQLDLNLKEIIKQEIQSEKAKSDIIQKSHLNDKCREQLNMFKQAQASLQASKINHQKLNLLLSNKIQEQSTLNLNFQEFLSLKYPLLGDIQKRIASLQKIKEHILVLDQLKQTELQVSSELGEIRAQLKKYSSERIQLNQDLNNIPDGSQKALELEKTLELSANSLEKDKLSLSKLEQSIVHQKEIQAKLSKEITELQALRSQLIIFKERNRWINSYFIPLTSHIEKEIMLKIYHYCNELFSEWFEILTEGSELSANLDSDFAPLISQQGHQINFNFLSGGERTAASLAYRLALTKAINGVMRQIRTKGLLILDEPTDGFSVEQLQRLRDCLEAIGLKQIIIVSHEAMMEGFVNHIVNIEKRGGVSIVS